MLQRMMNDLLVGIENFAREPKSLKSLGRCGLVCNQASVAKNYEPSWAIINKILDGNLRALFGPQHGFAGTAQDNMIETAHARHLGTGLPVYSLYSETREPTAAMLSGLDTILIDLQITGCRIYTWKSTIAACLRSGKKYGCRIVVLDRPNPLGGVHLEGRTLDSDAHSFVGEFPIPMRHGLTAGEAALFFNQEIGAELEVIPLKGWDPHCLAAQYYGPKKRPWIITSPNLPNLDPVYVYPGLVLLEGTNLSEGRGTGLPFQLIGAPYIKDSAAWINRIKDLSGGDIPGLYLRPAAFEPTSQKHHGKICEGMQIHVEDPQKVQSYRLALAVIRASIELGNGGFEWKSPPYEYNHETLPIKLIVGSHKTQQHFESSQFSVEDPFWKGGIEEFKQNAAKILLYPREFRE